MLAHSFVTAIFYYCACVVDDLYLRMRREQRKLELEEKSRDNGSRVLHAENIFGMLINQLRTTRDPSSNAVLQWQRTKEQTEVQDPDLYAILLIPARCRCSYLC